MSTPPAMATYTDVTAWTVDEVKEWAEEQWPGGEVAEKLAGARTTVSSCIQCKRIPDKYISRARC